MTNSAVNSLIKLQGTDYDRRRKLTLSDIRDIKKKYDNGHSIASLAKEYKVVNNTIHYHVDEEYKKMHNKRRNESTRSKYTYDGVKSRLEYKKQLAAMLLI